MARNNRYRIKSIWYFGKKYVPMFLIAEICILVSYAISVLLPINLTKLIDEVLYGGQYSLLPEIIKNYIFMFSSATVFNLIYAFVWQYLSNHYVLDVKNKLFEKIIFAKASFLSDMNSGDMMTRIDGDSEQFIHVVQRNLFHFINSAVMCLGIVMLVAQINITISAMLIISALLPIILTRLCGKFTEKYSKESREISGNMVGKLYEILKGFREIKIFKAENWATKTVLYPLKRLIKLGNKICTMDFLVDKGINLINFITTITIYAFSVFLVMKGEFTVGIFLAVIEYVSLLHKKFNWMLRIYLDWFNRKVSIDRVNEILALESESLEGEQIENIFSIEFKDVDFAYEKDNPVLCSLNFKINKGEKVAIVGNSGNGKTTTIALLLGFYKANKGTILVNGIPLSQIDTATLRRKMGIVSQDIMIFEDTIRYNLSLGMNCSNEEIWTVLKAVNLFETIKSLPSGIDTVISSSSHNLSGGQKQRLMIARLLLRMPDFIILDEATSALDIETEKAISEYISSISQDATMLIISHRLETIKNCDNILVLNEHKIEDSGTHKDLLKRSPTYAAMFGR